MSKYLHEKALTFLMKSFPFSERDLHFRNSIEEVDYLFLTKEEAEILTNIYFELKDLYLRKLILKNLSRCKEIQLEEFFLKAYKKERYLDIRLTAIRGYARFASHKEVEKVMQNFMKILIKRQENTPNNYQEYAFLLSPAGLPYLIKKYGYDCFQIVYEQAKVQYDAMEEQYKNRLTYDEEGNAITITKGMRNAIKKEDRNKL
ncbi:hypothetical protein RCG23_19910 [Neobacillus sp. PS3-34]|uniref:hypothetical protein n=1 Tax=Neobacillus sp. PS3-34 TaxID=3070678 RepID=UPI0027E00E37|nr:hypothetical protein [Neobacillus sp. PS3-34]WML47620.1 hypothetical protein RCG23_19910 [Neobacillus sp. PS3-34]